MTGAAALFTARMARLSSKESNSTTEWAEILKANNEQNARLNGEIRDLRDDQNELRTRVDDLEDRLEREQRVRRGAFDYIRTLLRWIETHMPGVTPPAPPEILKEDL
ncbi:hypothetical protein [Prescottella equi]|uniref:hypothetical protein n=1 Tax=Rhodococcus hoagii TaxID=43767 RepID=UPI001F32B5CE|nr:hypothetical protein [Prescottella equi]